MRRVRLGSSSPSSSSVPEFASTIMIGQPGPHAEFGKRAADLPHRSATIAHSWPTCVRQHSTPAPTLRLASVGDRPKDPVAGGRAKMAAAEDLRPDVEMLARARERGHVSVAGTGCSSCASRRWTT